MAVFYDDLNIACYFAKVGIGFGTLAVQIGRAGGERTVPSCRSGACPEQYSEVGPVRDNGHLGLTYIRPAGRTTDV
jgi:hypothetical protein